jgi:sulfonate transport system substrate-binding protein
VSSRVERRAFLTMAGTAAVAFTAGCRSSAAGGSTSGVELIVGDQMSRLRSLFDASGALQGAQYGVRWRQYSADASVFDALTDNAAEIGLAAAPPTLDALSADAEVDIVSASYSRGRGGLALLVPQDSAANSVAELKDTTVCATTWGSSGHYLLLNALRGAGLAKEDVQFNFRWPTLADRAFRVGDVAAWAAWDPFAANIEVDEAQARVLRPADDLDPGLSLLCAQREVLEDSAKRAAIADFRQRYVRAQQWAVANPDRYADKVFDLMEVPRPAARLTVRRARWTNVPLDERFARKMQQVADAMDRFEVLRHPVKASDHVRRSL